MGRNFFGFLMFCCLFSCNKNLVHSEYAALNNGVWNKDRTLQFQFNEPDTLDRHHLFLNVRNDENYEFSNLFLIVDLTFPNGNAMVDTLEYEMARPTGEWLGEGLGSIRESKLWYKEDIIFSDSGVYTINVQHAMRKNGEVAGVETLHGITDVGIQIEKAQ